MTLALTEGFYKICISEVTAPFSDDDYTMLLTGTLTVESSLPLPPPPSSPPSPPPSPSPIPPPSPPSPPSPPLPALPPAPQFHDPSSTTDANVFLACVIQGEATSPGARVSNSTVAQGPILYWSTDHQCITQGAA